MSTNLSKTDDGKQLTLNVGQDLTIRLPENPTTGYRWAVDEPTQRDPSTEILVFTDRSYSAEKAVGIGGGGMCTLTFNAQKAGVAELRLKLWQPSENDVDDRFHLTIHVQ